MNKLIIAEFCKNKRKLIHKLLVAAPVCILLLTVVLLNGQHVQSAYFNWWYMLGLPFVLGYIGASMISSEKRYHFHGLLSVIETPQTLWYGKIAVGMMYLEVLSLVVWLLGQAAGLWYGEGVSARNSICAIVVLFFVSLWQLPCTMWLTLKTNLVAAVVGNLMWNVLMAVFFADTGVWWIPGAIGARVMVPILRILPNGLTAEPGNPLGASNVIWIGIGISLLIFVVMSLLSARSFTNAEV